MSKNCKVGRERKNTIAFRCIICFHLIWDAYCMGGRGARQFYWLKILVMEGMHYKKQLQQPYYVLISHVQ